MKKVALSAPDLYIVGERLILIDKPGEPLSLSGKTKLAVFEMD